MELEQAMTTAIATNDEIHFDMRASLAGTARAFPLRMETKKTIFSAAAILSIVAGCQASAAVGVTSTTGAAAPNVSNSKAQSAIIQAHCTHAYRCNTFGGQHRFRDYDSCDRELRSETLTSPVCAHDIDASKLSQCLDSMRSAGCGEGSGVTFERLCSNQNLCQ